MPTPSLPLNAVLDWYRVYSSLAAMPCRSSLPPTALELLLHEIEATPREYWTNQKLYKKYGSTSDEIAFIESMVRPIALSAASEDGT